MQLCWKMSTLASINSTGNIPLVVFHLMRIFNCGAVRSHPIRWVFFFFHQNYFTVIVPTMSANFVCTLHDCDKSSPLNWIYYFVFICIGFAQVCKDCLADIWLYSNCWKHCTTAKCQKGSLLSHGNFNDILNDMMTMLYTREHQTQTHTQIQILSTYALRREPNV